MVARGATIERKVVDETGKASHMQRLWTYQQRSIELDLIFYQRDTTNEDGHFRLRGLNRGKYMALAFTTCKTTFSNLSS